MGCFSFICKESDKPVSSDSFNGDSVRMYLLENGKVIEEMRGEYDSYGRCFDSNGKSMEWKRSWSEVCDLMFSKNDGDGIAVILEEHFNGKIPTTKSEDDPEQGWSSTDFSINPYLKSTHIIYDKNEPLYKVN